MEKLGKNIKQLRRMHGETLGDLGDAVFVKNTTIKNYEKGDRLPDPEKVAAIAKHYGKTVDELINSDLTSLGDTGDVVNFPEGVEAWFDLWENMVPLKCSGRALDNPDFKKAYEKCCEMVNKGKNLEPIATISLLPCFDLFEKALDTGDLPEAAANIMWLILLLWSNMFDAQTMNNIMEVLNETDQKKRNKAVIKANNINTETQKMRAEFIEEMNDTVLSIIKMLKADPEWADLGDYYLGLRYVLGMVDTGLSLEMNKAVGMQMMLSLVQIGNDYAYRLLKTSLEL